MKVKDEIVSLVKHQLKRAKATYDDALTLVRKGSLESAMNRFYYAAFYAAKALLMIKGIDSSKHSRVIAQFHLHFVKDGQIDKEIASILARGFELRMETDYGDFVVLDREKIQEIQEKVRQFISACEVFLKKTYLEG